MKKHLISRRHVGILFSLFLSVFLQITGVAQPVCNGAADLSCFANTEDPNSIRCVNGEVTIGSLTIGVNPILLPAAQAANTPQYVVVNGNIRFNNDYVFAPGSEIVFTQNSAFTVEPTKTLRIHGAYLHGCTHLWAGITVQANAGIIFTDNTLEDAIRGINVEGGSGVIGASRIAAYNNTFKKSFISIYLGTEFVSSLNPRKISLAKGGITNNVFDGDGALLPGDVTYPNPFSGIWMSRITPITIGATGTPINFLPNVFKNYKSASPSPSEINTVKAIAVVQSSVTIQNSRFENIGALNGAVITGYGIWTNTGLDGVHTVTISGLGKNDVPTFEEVSCPISAHTGSLTVKQVNSTDSYLGIYYYNSDTPPSFPPGNIRIEDCKFDNYRSKTGAIFVGEGDKLLLSSLRISNCEIRDNQDLVFPASSGGVFDEPEFRSGIRIFSSEPASLGLLNIRDNQFYSDNKGQSATFNIVGVRMVNITGGRIADNECYDYNGASAPNSNKFKGIWLDNCQGMEVVGNKIHGNAGAYNVASKRSDGISLYESGSCYLRCNDLDLVRNGIAFEGEGCDQSTLVQNKFNTHHNGLYLFADAIIGQQGVASPHENQWLSSAALLDGNYDFAGFDPQAPFDVIRVDLSKFFINDANQSSIYWASPRSIDGVADLDYWFTYDNGQFPPAPSLMACQAGSPGPGGPRLSKADQYILANGYPAYLGHPASTWEAGLRLYANLAQNPSLRTSGSPAETFYNHHSTGALGKLYVALESIRYFGKATEAINDVQEEMAELLNQVFVLDEQIMHAANETEEAQLLAQREVLMEQVTQKQDEYEQLTASHRATAQQQAATQLASLNATTANMVWEQNLKTVLQMQLGILSSGLPLTEAQQITLQAIADQCRYEGGYGVLLARKMLPGQVYEEENLCSERNDKAGKADGATITVFPNPAGDFITLSTGVQLSDGSAILMNTFGHAVRAYTWAGRETRLNVADVPCGAYFLHVHSQGLPVQVRKVLIVR
ncbi:MAG: hypothetical protein SFV22_16910 [Saprospiraceae bacterium]|nr:hypothetical protein [Saprospiraceae bacterium]